MVSGELIYRQQSIIQFLEQAMTSIASGGSLASSLVSANPAARLALYVALTLAGSMLIALGAKTQVPFWPVPMTLQTLAILAIASAYGSRLAVATVLLYLAQGLYGLPVFANAGAGPAYFAGPTGGYLAGFVVMAGIAGWAADRGWSSNPLKLGAAMLAGEAAMLAMGAAWIAFAFGVEKAWAWGVGPFIVTDLVKLGIAACIVPALWFLRGK
jgi:biotin transport system substrate-specific component